MPREVDKREPWVDNGRDFEIAILKLISCHTGVCGNLRIEDMVRKQWQQTSKKRRVAGGDSDDDELPRYDTSDKTFEYFNKVLHVAIEHINIHLDAEADDKAGDNAGDKADDKANDKAGDKAGDKAKTGGDQDAGCTPFMPADDMRAAFYQKLEESNAKKAGDKADDKADEKAEAEDEEKALKAACSPAFVKAVEKADLKRKLDEILADESSMTSREKLARIEAAFDVKKAERDDASLRTQFKQTLKLLSESCARLKRAAAARDAAIAENLVLKALTLDLMQQRNAGAAGAKG